MQRRNSLANKDYSKSDERSKADEAYLQNAGRMGSSLIRLPLCPIPPKRRRSSRKLSMSSELNDSGYGSNFSTPASVQKDHSRTAHTSPLSSQTKLSTQTPLSSQDSCYESCSFLSQSTTSSTSFDLYSQSDYGYSSPRKLEPYYDEAYSPLAIQTCTKCNVVLDDDNKKNEIDISKNIRICGNCVKAIELLKCTCNDWYLIGRRVGKARHDIIGSLYNEGQHEIVYKIMGLLSEQEVYTVSNVSQNWKDICLSDRTLKRKRASYLKSIRICQKDKENYTEVILQSNIQIKSLKQDDTLTHCTECRGMAKIYIAESRAKCMACSYQICMKCKHKWHPMVNCKIYDTIHKKHCIGSAKSRKNLKRL